ncbi:MBL fold metallo-hydrolase [Treponema sp. OMZ 840]|uniref:MBL fold metallo-hydrolase n=1 Tax=Treponema sp. OMZ 840 TaxID=244313 RepID=UPI003D8A0DA1
MKVYFHLNIEGFSNAYLILNPAVKEAIIIDPGKITIKMIEQIEQHKYTLAAAFITHNHKSHTMGLTTLQKIYSPKIYAADYEVAKAETTVLKGDGIINAAGLNISYMSLPGHTADSMVYKIGQCLFTGDVLLAGQAGNTNSTYAKKTLIANITSKILSQQENTVIMPGHGPLSTVGAEKKFNLDFS